MVKSNPSWKHGYRFLFYRKDNDVSIGIRNGKEMTSFFMDLEDAKQLLNQLQDVIEDFEHGEPRDEI